MGEFLIREVILIGQLGNARLQAALDGIARQVECARPSPSIEEGLGIASPLLGQYLQLCSIHRPTSLTRIRLQHGTSSRALRLPIVAGWQGWPVFHDEQTVMMV